MNYMKSMRTGYSWSKVTCWKVWGRKPTGRGVVEATSVRSKFEPICHEIVWLAMSVTAYDYTMGAYMTEDGPSYSAGKIAAAIGRRGRNETWR